MFKLAAPHLEKTGGAKNMKVLTGIGSTCCTVIVELETDGMDIFFEKPLKK